MRACLPSPTASLNTLYADDMASVYVRIRVFRLPTGQYQHTHTYEMCMRTAAFRPPALSSLAADVKCCAAGVAMETIAAGERLPKISPALLSDAAELVPRNFHFANMHLNLPSSS